MDAATAGILGSVGGALVAGTATATIAWWSLRTQTQQAEHRRRVERLDDAIEETVREWHTRSAPPAPAPGDAGASEGKSHDSSEILFKIMMVFSRAHGANEVMLARVLDDAITDEQGETRTIVNQEDLGYVFVLLQAWMQGPEKLRGWNFENLADFKRFIDTEGKM